tara:strand:- start:41 stop:286 length:246 start_codon:yes stop_codon:yes gene_type:complete
MNHYLILVYGICFSLIGGAAFAMMWANIKSINEMNTPIKTTKHPEAPKEGEEVMYVDVSDMNSKQFSDQKQKLENLFKNED